MDNAREKYINERLMELACIAANRELEEIEQREEKRLLAELKEIQAVKEVI